MSFAQSSVVVVPSAFVTSTSFLHLSGWYRSDSFRYAFLISFWSTSSSSPRTSYRSRSSSRSSLLRNVAEHFSPSCTRLPLSRVSAAASIFVGRSLCRPAWPHRM